MRSPALPSVCTAMSQIGRLNSRACAPGVQLRPVDDGRPVGVECRLEHFADGALVRLGSRPQGPMFQVNPMARRMVGGLYDCCVGRHGVVQVRDLWRAPSSLPMVRSTICKPTSDTTPNSYSSEHQRAAHDGQRCGQDRSQTASGTRTARKLPSTIPGIEPLSRDNSIGTFTDPNIRCAKPATSVSGTAWAISEPTMRAIGSLG